MKADWRVTDIEFLTAETGNSSDETGEIADFATSFEGYEAFDFHWFVEQVADRLYNIHAARNIEPSFVFTLTTNSAGEIDGGMVMLTVPGTLLYLSRSLEFKRMTDDRLATGINGLLAIKSALMDAYGELIEYAFEKALI